jgi:hypothetical protein
MGVKEDAFDALVKVDSHRHMRLRCRARDITLIEGQGEQFAPPPT